MEDLQVTYEMVLCEFQVIPDWTYLPQQWHWIGADGTVKVFEVVANDYFI